MANLPDRFRSDQPFGRIDPRGQWILDEESAGLLNELREEMVRLGQVEVELPLTVASDAAGTRLAIEQPRTMFAKVTGSTSPYAWAEAKKDENGVPSVLTGGLSGTDAYEANGQAGLNGKYVTMDWSRAGDWRFQLTRTGTINPNPCLTYCIKINGPDLAGLTATLVGTVSGSPWTKDVTIGSGGNACYDVTGESPVPTITGARVTSSCGTTSTSTFTKVGTTCTATFYYCKRIVRVHYTAAAGSTISPGISGTVVDDGSTMTVTSCYLSTTNPGSTYFNPLTVTATSSNGSVGAYPGTCATGVVPCGGTLDLDVTQEDFSADYFRADGCDLGCSYGKGPCNRGLIPKRIQIKFTKISTYDLFAGDEGQWIDLYGTVTATAGSSAVAVKFDSGCRGGMGNMIYAPQCTLNVDPIIFGTPAERVLSYPSTRATLTWASGFSGNVEYMRYPTGSCTGAGGSCYDIHGAGPNAPLNCRCDVTDPTGAGTDLCSPCGHFTTSGAVVCAGRVSGGGSVTDGSTRWRAVIRELGCGGTYDGLASDSPGDLAMMAAPPGSLVVRGHANSFTGYGQHTTAFAKELERAGYAVAWDPIDSDATFLPLDPWVADRIIGKPGSKPDGTDDAAGKDNA